MTAWKAIGPLTTSDIFLFAAVVLLLPRFSFAKVRRMWVPALAVALIAVGGVIGTAVTSGADVRGSAGSLVPLLAASFGAIVLIGCWRPGLEQIRSFSWLWVAGGVCSAIVAFLIPHLHMFIRPSGLTPQSNHLAIISVILLGITLGLIASDRRRKPVLVGLSASGILFAGIVASGSRAGLAAALLVVVVTLIATRDRIAVAATVGLVVVGLAIAMLGVTGDENALERLTSGSSASASASAEQREAFNAAGWDRFKSHPVTGAGFADVLEPHNFFLQLGSAAGVLGLIGGVMLVVLALKSYATAVWKRMSERPAYWAMVAGLATAVIGYLGASMFQNVLWDRNIWIAIVLMTWAAAASVGRAQGVRADPAH